MPRLLNGLIALVATAAMLLVGPIGSGGVAVAAEGGAQESRLQREVDRLPAPKRAELEAQIAAAIAAAGTNLDDPATRRQTAQTLGVSQVEVDRAVEAAKTGTDAGPILFLFIAIALTFAPSIFHSIGTDVFQWLGEVGGIEGLEPF
ncbi:MAG: hypothetical protein JST59_19190 [Actinobacteria bacterium]|nr:hypothetical protein [Actinomycetota bacterium]